MKSFNNSITRIRRTGATRGNRSGAKNSFEQGDLDRLCGVYVIVNAVKQLCPALNDSAHKVLFEAMMTALRMRDQYRRPIIIMGMSCSQLVGLIALAFDHLRRQYGINLVARRIGKSVAGKWGIGVLWGFLDQRLGSDCVAILGLAGRHNHWTLATAVTPRQLRLADSDGLHVLKRQLTTTRPKRCNMRLACITADMVILVRRL